jgi:putative addiction module component (TIGR02574 family)
MALWESLTDEERAAELELNSEQRAELDRRWEEHLENPESAIPWEDVRRKLTLFKPFSSASSIRPATNRPRYRRWVSSNSPTEFTVLTTPNAGRAVKPSSRSRFPPSRSIR